MNIFIRYITNLLIGLLKKIWYFIKLERLNKELDNEKREADEAIKEANDAVADFEQYYSVFNSSETISKKNSSETESDS